MRPDSDLFEVFFQSCPLGCAIADLDGKLRAVNPAACRIWDRSSKELVGRHVNDFTIEEDHDVSPRMFTALRNGKLKVAEFEKHYRRPKGQLVRIKATASLIHDLDGNPSGFIGILQDITELKKREEERTLLTMAIEQAAEAVVITDDRGIINYVNPAFEAVTGYTREEVIGRNPRILHSGKHGVEFYRNMWDVLTAGNIWRGVIVNKRKDGSLFEEEAVISPVRDPYGQVTHYVAVKHDISNVRQLEDQLVRAQKLDAIGKLAGGVAHDFNNMLTAILNHAQFVRDGLPGGSEAVEDIDAILNAARSSSDLTRQLLTLSRDQEVRLNIVNINDVIQGMHHMLDRMTGERIQLRLALSLDACMVKADTAQVQQIVTNLMLNARDAMPEGGEIAIETARLRLDSLDEMAFVEPPDPLLKDMIMIGIRDTGAGMDAATASKIFEPFFTTKEQSKGTGLGLPTVMAIVKRHGGNMAVHSMPGKGTLIRVFFPEVSEEDEVKEGDAASDLDSVRGHETILVVEDDTAARRVISRFLTDLGYKVIEAEGGAAAIQKVLYHKDEIDLLFTDVIMPDFDGKTLADQVKGMLPDIRIIFSTGYPASYLDEAGIKPESGIMIIQKPFDRAEVGQVIRSALDA